MLVSGAGPHHGDGAGGRERTEGQSHRGVRSRSALLQGTRPEGMLHIYTVHIHFAKQEVEKPIIF